MIRHARQDDIPALAVMGIEFHKASGFAEFRYVPDDFAVSLANLMQLDGFICLVADEGRVMGAVAGIVSPVYFDREHLSGEELFWWAEPDAPQMTGLRLLTALEDEARAMGCASWQMKAIDRLNGDRMAKYYERNGYRPSEHSFIKRL